MKDVLAAAATAWPDLPAPDETFGEAVAARAGDGDAHALQVGDLFVAFHAAAGHPRAVAHVEGLVSGLRNALKRTGAGEQLVRDLLAELPGDLLAARTDRPARILGYSGRGPLGAWLRVVAVRAIVERRRQTKRAPHVARTIGERATEAYDPELELLRRRYTDELEGAFARAFDALSPEQRLLLTQHHVDGLSIDRLAVLHGIHRATAARRVASVREALFEGVRVILVDELRIGDETFESIVRLVRSEIDINLDRHAESWHALGAE